MPERSKAEVKARLLEIEAERVRAERIRKVEAATERFRLGQGMRGSVGQDVRDQAKEMIMP